MAEIVGLAASAAGGGVFGLIGTALGRLAGVFEHRQYYAHERARWAHDLTMLEQRGSDRAVQAASALAQSEQDGRWSGLNASIEAERAIGESYLWVNAVRGLTRPFLTLLLWLITGAVFCFADDVGRANIIETATFAATAATLWWFGDRGPKHRKA